MERGRDFFEARAAAWDEKRNTDKARLEFLVEMAGLPAGGRILDVGSGTGVLLPYLLAAAGGSGEVTAIDYSPAMLRVAQGKFSSPRLSFICDDVLTAPLPSGLDLVVSLNFFPHLTTLADKQAYLVKVREALRPGGKIVIMHDVSREFVNGVHSHAPETFNDRLPSARDTGILLVRAGFSEVFGVEDDFIYFAKGEKI